MDKIFILTDLMYSGQHQMMQKFIESAEIPNLEFTFEAEYWNLHSYNWDEYDQLICIIDHKDGYENNPEFVDQLHKRMDLLKQNGFKFILARPWECEETVSESKFYNLLTNYDYKKWFGDHTWFWFVMRDKHKGMQYNCNHSHKPYHFLYLNKYPRPHRKLLWKQLKQKNLLDRSLHSFLGLDTPVRLDPEYELPWVDRHKYPKLGSDQDFFSKPYEHTACSLISETTDGNNIFITEKLWKPILNQHFFIVHGNHLYLQKIREIGFKTFSKYFDESYDLESDRHIKIKKIVKLIEDLHDFDWQDAYMNSRALRQHNYDLFWNKQKYCDEVAEKIFYLLGQ